MKTKTEIHVAFGEIQSEGAELTIGTRYKVTWEDCCTEGGFTAALVSVNYSTEPDSADSVDSLTFDNGVTCDGVTLEPEPGSGMAKAPASRP